MSVPANRPGLDALAYRIGTYGTFMHAMTERLSATLPALTTRDLDDPSIALLDGWAMIADVLTFYQERIANEGFVRTATEKRSLLEFANLAGYRPRPGVAASVFLAYTLEKSGAVTLAAGNKAQSIPGPGQTAQTFETADALDARATWNTLGIRTTQPQDPSGTQPFFLSTITTNLKPNDVLLFVRNGTSPTSPDELPAHRFVRVGAVETQPLHNRTKITLQGAGLVWDSSVADSAALEVAAGQPASGQVAVDRSIPDAERGNAATTLLARIGALKTPLLRPPSAPPRSPQRLVRSASETLGPDLDVAPQLFAALHPDAAANVYAALAAASAPVPASVDVYAFRVHAAPYGHNAPAPPVRRVRTAPDAGRANANPEERMFEMLHALVGGTAADEERTAAPDWPLAFGDRNPRNLSLDARYDRIAPGGFVGIRTFPADEPVLFTVTDTRERSRRDYGLAATTTVLTLNAGYFTEPNDEHSLAPLRDVDVFAQSEQLTLADVPLAGDIPDDPQADPTILELDGLYDGLAPGRWAIVAGTRTDLAGVAGAELVMIAATKHATNPAIAGDSVHTFVTLSTKLAYRYARSSVTIAGNVIRATHGETRTETIGSGDASQARQRFALKAKPLTFVSAPTQSGTRSTLTIRVNGIGWTENDDVNALGPTDRAYSTVTTDAGTTVIFGDGIHGARLPTGAENVTATYRAGLGAPGNLDPAKISLLMSRPLGVKAVGNPLPAAGGADSESPGELRRNIPTALLALDRLVALSDYATFARTFAGVAKAAVVQIGAGSAATVFLTLAGPDDASIDAHGDLVANLAAALRALGDPRQAFAIGSCERVLLFVGAQVDIAPDAVWETVEPAIRSALGAVFGFDARDFGQPAYKSEAIAAIQNVAGVIDVAIDLFAGMSEITDATLARLTAPGLPAVADDVIAALPARRRGTTIAPAQLVALDPSVRDTIVLRTTASRATP